MIKNINDLSDFTNKFKELILSSKNIGIVGHMSPDGDAIGSALALYDAIRQLNNNTFVLQIDEMPDYLSFMPGLNKFTEYNDEIYDLQIIVDSSSADRIGDCQRSLEFCKNSVVIDHHVSNEYFGDINYIIDTASSTCEIVYEIIDNMNLSISKDMAECIFVGILTDTNRFLYSNSSDNTLRIAANLIDKDIDKDFILYNLYQRNSMASFKLTQEVIKATEFYEDNKISMAVISLDMLNIAGANQSDIEDKINLIRDIDSVELACLIKQVDCDLYKISLRSKRYVDVAEICTEFGGGGHIHAGGFAFSGDIKDLKKRLIKRFDKIDWSKI